MTAADAGGRDEAPDYYAQLQVDPRADPEVIEAAYRRLARKWHPDASDDPRAAQRMRELNEAYAVLRDPARRRAYDAARPRAPGAPAASRSAAASAVVLAALVLVAVALGARLVAALGRLVIVPLAVAAAAYWVWVRWARRR